MKVLFDTNVVLDVLLRRGEWVQEAETLWKASLAGTLKGCVNASAVTDIYYISRRLVGRDGARQVVRACIDALGILDVGRETLEHAYSLQNKDFEDALQIASAVRHALDAIVTRDPAGFADSPVEVLSPTGLIAHLQGA